MNKNTNQQFLIGSWVSFYPFDVDSYERQLDQMQQAGLNFNIFPFAFGGSMDTPETCDRVEREYAARNMLYLMKGELTEEGIAQCAQYARDKEHCIGYQVKDEPTGDDLPDICRVARAYRAADGARYPFVNLLPSYAGEARLGGSYYEYCSRFVREVGANNVEYLSHDFYPFGEKSTNIGIFSDMEVIRRTALENGRLRTHAFPQASAWNGMRMPNADEMRWNAYAYLAYGFKALSWFNLVCPGQSDTEGEGFRDSLIYRDGTIRDPQLFEDFSALNHEILTLGDTLMQLDTVHAYHTDDSVDGVELLPEDWMLTPVRTESFVISHMINRTGDCTYVMLFNKNWQKTVTASFAVSSFSGIEELEYVSPFDGSHSAVSMENGVFTDTFRPSEGKLYKLNGKLSHRAAWLDATHTRVDVDLALPGEIVGLDLAGAVCESGSTVSVRISTNKRFTADRTVVYDFESIPANGQLRFEPAVGKYVRAIFSNRDGAPIQGVAEARVRYAEEFFEVEAEEMVDETAEEIVEMAVEETAEETAEGTAEETVEEIVEMTFEETAEDTAGAVAEETTEETVVETAEAPVAEENSVPAEEIVPEAEESSPVLYDVDYRDLDEARAVVEGLVEAEYSAESWQAVKSYYQLALSMKDGTHPQDEITDAYWQLLDRVRELIPIQWTLPKPAENQLPEDTHAKKNVHVTGGVLAVAAATVAGTVAGVFAGIFSSKNKKKRKK